MSIETIDILLFHWINSAATQNPILDKIALFASHNLIAVLFVFLICSLFFKNKKYRGQFVKTLMTVLVSLLVTQLIHAVYYHPRPFDLGIGHILTGHGSSSSFPSQHTLTVATIAFSYLLSGYRKIGSAALLLGFIVGWSRVYIGVHFPFDVIGSFMIAFILVLGMKEIFKIFILSVKKPILISVVEEEII
ncbi:undecaprenyl-diphosphatase [Acinetobacter sp. ANC 3882]|uniref:undecaprenyl-diphosphatase n=1 Tax=Acinetobacter sp. ANC 3882 TaxID=2923423 RepID=UPI001F4B7F72|nr:undecaprenyl-diphosphatase [Acinetobacter sp. ANC 3882]MCH7313758.1 undecaprenyl-diphosphatase [Acinetobacter sp. ANC 3882]